MTQTNVEKAHEVMREIGENFVSLDEVHAHHAEGTSRQVVSASLITLADQGKVEIKTNKQVRTYRLKPPVLADKYMHSMVALGTSNYALENYMEEEYGVEEDM